MSSFDLDPAELPCRVTVESAAGSGDLAGGESTVWDSVATLWARIDPVTADEKIVAGHLAGVVTHLVTFRWRGDLAGGMRIAYRGRTFRVLAVDDPDEMRRYIVAKCEEEKP